MDEFKATAPSKYEKNEYDYSMSNALLELLCSSITMKLMHVVIIQLDNAISHFMHALFGSHTVKYVLVLQLTAIAFAKLFNIFISHKR